jgi:hypothetical protein
MTLPDGLYDLLLTDRIANSLAMLDPLNSDVLALKDGASSVLADAIARQLATILEDVAGDGEDRAKLQLELVNELLVGIRLRLAKAAGKTFASIEDEVDLVASPLRVLKSIRRDQQFPLPPAIWAYPDLTDSFDVL